MGTKLVTEDAWSKFAKKHKLDRNRNSVALEKALTRYEELEDDESDDPMEKWKQLSALHKQSEAIQNVLAQLMKEKEVKNGKEISDELSEISSYWRMKEKVLQTETDRAREAASKVEDEERAEDQKEKSLPDRLMAAAQSISGSEGKRLQAVMAIAKRSESSWKSLWYYNYEAVAALVEQPGRHKSMTRATNGKPPFKGDTGGWGEWIVEPFDKPLKAVGGKNASDKDLVTFLKWLDGQIANSMNKMAQASKAAGKGGTDDSVEQFYKHVTDLAKGRSHLYSAGY
jgi:hypothetical protein